MLGKDPSYFVDHNMDFDSLKRIGRNFGSAVSHLQPPSVDFRLGSSVYQLRIRSLTSYDLQIVEPGVNYPYNLG